MSREINEYNVILGSDYQKPPIELENFDSETLLKELIKDSLEPDKISDNFIYYSRSLLDHEVNKVIDLLEQNLRTRT